MKRPELVEFSSAQPVSTIGSCLVSLPQKPKEKKTSRKPKRAPKAAEPPPDDHTLFGARCSARSIEFFLTTKK